MREDDNHIDINFKGYYFNSLQNSDSKIEISAPTPLPNNLSESQKISTNKSEIDNSNKTTNKNLKS